ncbi:MAG: ATP-dependent Clp protease adaptor ClpS [Phycisphaerales bacterium]
MSEHADTGLTEGDHAAATLPMPARKPALKQPRLWNVVLLNDDDHSYEYVISMMQRVFSAPLERAFQVAKTVDSDGRAICGTYHKELAELKLDQMHSCGRDASIASCKGPMSAILEPADAGDEA